MSPTKHIETIGNKHIEALRIICKTKMKCIDEIADIIINYTKTCIDIHNTLTNETIQTIGETTNGDQNNGLEEVQRISSLYKSTCAIIFDGEPLSKIDLNNRDLGELSLELKSIAQKIILEKVGQIKVIQDEVQKQALEEAELIENKYAKNQPIMDILFNVIGNRLTSTMNNSTKLINEIAEKIIP